MCCDQKTLVLQKLFYIKNSSIVFFLIDYDVFSKTSPSLKRRNREQIQDKLLARIQRAINTNIRITLILIQNCLESLYLGDLDKLLETIFNCNRRSIDIFEKYNINESTHCPKQLLKDITAKCGNKYNEKIYPELIANVIDINKLKEKNPSFNEFINSIREFV